MLWFYGIGGGIVGFLIGQAVIFHLLKDTPAKEIRENKDLKVRYGLLNWAFVIVGVLIGINVIPSLFS